MTYTEQEIELEVSKISGNHIKRNNLRLKLRQENNATIESEINSIRKKVRCLKAQGLYESDFREMYSEITKLELQIL